MILGNSFSGTSWERDLLSVIRLTGFDGKAPVFCQQIHSGRVYVVRSGGLAGRGDGLVTDRQDLALCIQTADCIPIFLYAPEEGTIGLVHAGWRGTSRGIVVNALETMKAVSGIEPASVEIFMGPSIRPCCYVVGRDVASRFDQRFVTGDKKGLLHLDLPGASAFQMASWGVRPSQIHQDGRCTSCHSDGLYSYRRDGTRAGRMICIMALKEER
ncbi:MAG: peptidoglycan editing factor PgeF [Fidelibacterota bacterium]